MPEALNPIIALPAEDIAQIKSSVTITSLVDVVNGLVCNSLDAQASKVRVFVDSSRGNCVVEDDGIGIPPTEFTEEGGLAKAYNTSKSQSSGLHGGHGTFISSVAALAFLTITSRHTSNSTGNTLTCHRSKIMSRHTPALPQDDLSFSTFGTRVTVRNLFGSMPVRIKQRAVQGYEGENGREWRDVIREIVSLLLAWQYSVVVTLNAESIDKKLKLGTPHSTQSGSGQSDKRKGKSRHSDSTAMLHRNLNVLTQAGFVEIGSWPSWVPVAATTFTVSIKGAISLDPAPTKQAQFIAFGVRPVSSDSGANELYREINSIFSNSRFGVVDDMSVLDEAEQLRRSRDRRFKKDAFTRKRIKGGRKGIDRWPMFFLRIEYKNDPKSMSNGELKAEDAASLQSILSILGAMVTQWLTEHHFQPHKLRHDRNMLQNLGAMNQDVEHPSNHGADLAASESSTSCGPFQTKFSDLSTDKIRPSTPDCTMNGKSSKRNLTDDQIFHSDHENSFFHPRDPPLQPKISAFQTWSRIKSGKCDFFDQSDIGVKRIVVLSKPIEGVASSRSSVATTINTAPVPTNPSSISQDLHDVGIDLNESNNTESMDKVGNGKLIGEQTAGTIVDEFIPWKHPVTREAFVLNTRSGLLLPDDKQTSNAHLNHFTSSSGIKSRPEQKRKSVRLETREKQTQCEKVSTEWITGLLDDWDNPVFQSSERAMPRYTTDLPFPELQAHQGCSSRYSKSVESSQAASKLYSRMSTSGLKTAEVISQLDNKFILIKMSCTSGSAEVSNTASTNCSSILVIVDQHAADERCKIEALLKELCTPYPTTMPALKSNLGHSPQVLSVPLQKPIIFQTTHQEVNLLRTRAAFFAKWGILFDLGSPSTTTRTTEHSDKIKNRVTITALPPGILERCTAEPLHIISILRSEAWSRSSTPSLPPKPTAPTTTTNHPSPATKPTEIETQKAPNPTKWHTCLSSCPKGIIDLLNSRACRSAIMFNDALSKEQCGELVRGLAECVFPWQCAHGRPCVVPLVGLGEGAMGWGSRSVGGDGGGSSNEDGGDESGLLGFLGGEVGFRGTGRRRRGGGGDGEGESGGFVGAFRQWRKREEGRGGEG